MVTSNTNASSDVRDGILAIGQRVMSVKGYSAVGINEILTAARVPKGSFYHYFASKDAFGEAMLRAYFDEYQAAMERTLGGTEGSSAKRLLSYFAGWRDTQSLLDCQGKCLAVKLGAEVADLSESMRAAMMLGTDSIVSRLTQAIQAGRADKSLLSNTDQPEPAELAESLYQLWMGASVLAKVARSTRPFEAAMASTRRLLQLAT